MCWRTVLSIGSKFFSDRRLRMRLAGKFSASVVVISRVSQGNNDAVPR